MVDEYKEHTLPSGECICMDYDETFSKIKPWVVFNVLGEEVRWQVSFATKEEAEKEYIRFD